MGVADQIRARAFFCDHVGRVHSHKLTTSIPAAREGLLPRKCRARERRLKCSSCGGKMAYAKAAGLASLGANIETFANVRHGWKADIRLSLRARYAQLMTRPAAVERAYSLAQSGQCRSVAAIIRRLPEQDRVTVEEHLRTPAARRELILVCSDAWVAAG
jgi:hypothetical protein